VRAAAPTAKVYLTQMETFPNLGIEYAAGYRDVFPRAAAASGATLLPFPLEGIAGVPALNQADGIHPTAPGAEKMADQIWVALEPALRAPAAP
jgi:acyl-CoA thioesterase-1